MLHRLQQAIKNDLIAGLLVVIPLATTIWLSISVSSWVLDLLTRIPKQVNPFKTWHPLLVDLLNVAVGILVPLTGILLIGLMARNIFGQWLLNTGESILKRIPLAGTIYKVLQQLLETILRDSRDRFRRVVLVEYPRSGLWAVAFVTGTINGSLQTVFSEPMLSLFIPSSPNPTTGWYVIASERDVRDLDISIEDAFKLIISGGIVTPGSVPPSSLSPAPASLR
ncbi:DUF502 domain-containing protein [Thermosynechococcus sp. JY1334]|uniref:DUF502 domain-containing protein n=1 Tax=unclassified Thermosynechococcus TaxID=2622553 RepID=UPI002673AE94|nr:MULTISPECIES: DUF502 domain-containing protein [unclassified Thermosynechococcus]MDR7898774.1 DUF502 domain-containing protein [Thermosynechococcus sp. JY1332]MDR7906178.1 DUF502 domain-containing protein [Thermosynechococcus sp. JY1334]MDR7993999.1 DUF502 domain-containing protein [Thermosynechococcus sp. TG252]WKT85904.1 DUF502 domain-containing protein [Thermosynechococcus sp. JY1339]WNC54847.1 DUF502 domain-containing protein [Thermosynechococcus sp. JY1331]